jgi:GDSL-like Lipase/Acylhydrolase family
MKRFLPLLTACLAWGSGPWCLAQTAATVTAPVTTLRVQTTAKVPDIQCTATTPKPPTDKAIDPDPPELPDELEVQRQLNAWQHPPALTGSNPEPGKWWPVRPGEPLRVGFWGDSHLAAGFFTGEWARLSGLPAEHINSRFIAAHMGRAGVRLPLRKSCVDAAWRYEPGHAVAAGAASPGPGLVNLYSAQAGARLSWDLRNAAGQADKRQIRLLYQQTTTPLLLSLRVDDGPERQVDLQGPPGPAVLELLGDAPLSVVQIQLQAGALRLHGMEWPLPAGTRLQMDVFGYPGATVAGWKSVAVDNLRAWWGTSPYDVVVLAFGTNEGNVQPFDAYAYGQLLKASVGAWRVQFPAAQCVLIAPGDRGVLVRRSQKGAKTSADVLRFTRVHEEIGRLQRQVAAAHGCRFWSALEAMDGAGGAYRWVRHNPPWMARDLIHFTVPGYQRLAQGFARDMAWSSAVFEP